VCANQPTNYVTIISSIQIPFASISSSWSLAEAAAAVSSELIDHDAIGKDAAVVVIVVVVVVAVATQEEDEVNMETRQTLYVIRVGR
jgi:hypothetical protein